MYPVQSTIKQTVSTPSARPPILTRNLLAAGGATALVRRDEPLVRLISDVERKASLAEFMERRPPGDLWMFAYGSLVWNPALRVAERRIAQVRGWHRSFCLSMVVGRGTPDEPGLVLGLDHAASATASPIGSPSGTLPPSFPFCGVARC